MASRIWNEKGRTWEDDHGLLDESQMAQCIRADQSEFKSPVPTRMISNGEYMPALQTEKQARVEQRIGELADGASSKLSVDRRTFLAGSGGMAAAFVAMNEVFGRFFTYRPAGTGDGRPHTGLGLAIVKAIVEAHGGTVGVANRPGGGAVFEVSLPLA